MSDSRLTTIERAFQLARAGACHTIGDIRNQLTAERYEHVHSHTHGDSIQRQLRALLAARGARSTDKDDDE